MLDVDRGNKEMCLKSGTDHLLVYQYCRIIRVIFFSCCLMLCQHLKISKCPKQDEEDKHFL